MVRPLTSRTELTLSTARIPMDICESNVSVELAMNDQRITDLPFLQCARIQRSEPSVS